MMLATGGSICSSFISLTHYPPSPLHWLQACVALGSMGEEYVQLSNFAVSVHHRRFYGRCALDVLEVLSLITRRAFVQLVLKPLTPPKHCVRVRRTRLGDHVDTLSATFALARAFMFMGYVAEAEDLAIECERLAAALLHASARARVRVAGMRAQLLEERGQLQEAEQR